MLKASTVEADRREAWVTARVRGGADVLICHPRLVQTGLDLVDWPSVVWYETDYSVYVMCQASRRSWRIGQRQPVEVTFLVYEGTLQSEALALVAAKMRSALVVEGELPEDGLAALEGDGQDVFLALARRLTAQSTGDGQSLEALLARPRDAEVEADDYLVDGDWKATVPTPRTSGGGCSAARFRLRRVRRREPLRAPVVGSELGGAHTPNPAAEAAPQARSGGAAHALRQVGRRARPEAGSSGTAAPTLPA